ncbi:MAG: hypothetical protein E7644_04535 [Ruminococcaceae bacterium]|nr:hypothetical protein [Oscillospiraceae bacterium]
MDVNEARLNTPPERPTCRTVVKETSARMGKRGVMVTMLGSLLFCGAATYMALCLSELLIALVHLLPVTELTLALFTDGFHALGFLAFFLLVMPLWLGRLRMSGLLWRGDVPVAGELFYYFTAGRRLLRAWRVSFVALAGAFFPVGVIFILYQCAYFLQPGAMLILYTVGVALLALGLLLLSGFWLPFVGIAVGNESLPVRHALELALRAGRRHFKLITRFTLRSLLWLALSLVTMGVLLVLYFAHFYNLSYLRLCMAICPKEEHVQ